jgi:hypothetical protein
LPNLLSLTTCCVCPEPRPLPSAGVTRFHRYYEPLRHPSAPGSSLAGVRLIFLTTPWGLPCCVRFPCVHAVATTPARRLGASSARFPSRISLPRYGSRVVPRIDLFEAYTAFTCVTACTLALSPSRDTHIRRLQLFRYLHSCSGCFRLEHLPGGGFTHWESVAFPRRTPTSVSEGNEMLAPKRTLAASEVVFASSMPPQ